MLTVSWSSYFEDATFFSALFRGGLTKEGRDVHDDNFKIPMVAAGRGLPGGFHLRGNVHGSSSRQVSAAFWSSVAGRRRLAVRLAWAGAGVAAVYIQSGPWAWRAALANRATRAAPGKVSP